MIFYRKRERVYCADVTSHVIDYRVDVTGIAMVYSAQVIGHF